MKTLVNLILFLLFFTNISAQKAPLRFGKVSKEELKMEYCRFDSSAPAVVLCDYGYLDERDLRFRRILRIKILKKEGLKYGDYVLPSSWSTTIRGKTINFKDGKIVTDKLKNESIFNEHVYDKFYRYRIGMPNVQVGSIIDIEFTHLFPPNVWYFQWKIPVLHSELIIPSSTNFTFRKTYFGYIPLDVNSFDRWIAKNVPAFVEEPFINSLENYISKFEIELLDINSQTYHLEFSTDWDAVARRLEEHKYFGDVINSAPYLNNLKDEIQQNEFNKVVQMKMAYEKIKKIKWNQKERLFPTHPLLSYRIKEKVGNSAEINLLLLNLLRKLDIKAHPVIMSSRSNGSLLLSYPSLNKLNYVIVYVELEDKKYLLDATDDDLPIGLLPVRSLNETGRVLYLDKRTTEEISLLPDGKESDVEMITVSFNNDLDLSGKVSILKKEYAALNFRNHFKTYNSEEDYLENFMKEHVGLNISNCEIENMEDIYKPIRLHYSFTLKNHVQKLDSLLLLNPFLHLMMKENPFILEKRKYPVSFPYLKNKTITIKINLPTGYRVQELPKPMVLSLPDNAGKVIYQMVHTNNTLTLSYKYMLNKHKFLPNEYSYLREFYNQIINKQSELVILEKI